MRALVAFRGASPACVLPSCPALWLLPLIVALAARLIRWCRRLMTVVIFLRVEICAGMVFADVAALEVVVPALRRRRDGDVASVGVLCGSHVCANGLREGVGKARSLWRMSAAPGLVGRAHCRRLPVT